MEALQEVGVLTALYDRAYEAAVIIQRSVALTDDVLLLLLGCEIYNMVVVKIHYAVLHLTVRCLDESQIVDLGIHTERRDKTDVRSFRRLDRAETSVVGIVYVTDLESCTLTRQTARAQG